MTPEEWHKICDEVTDAMREHTRPFVTDLSSRRGSYYKLVGSASYIMNDGQRLLLTCEHVARLPDLEHGFWKCASHFRVREPFMLRSYPIDAAWSLIPDEMWSGIEHQALEIPYERFAPKHAIADLTEILFFRGFAGENAQNDLVKYEAAGSGYCSQAKLEVKNDPRIIEVFWEPDKTSTTSGTTEESKAKMKFEDPAGFSGSLLWNTRYRECKLTHQPWNPTKAAVTGIVREYDPSTKTLLVLRVEHLRGAIESA